MASDIVDLGKQEEGKIETVESIIGKHGGAAMEETAYSKSLVMKSDILILPLMVLTYLIAYLDRNNIGNARLMTFQKDTNMSASQYFSCVQIFYGGYLLGIFPGNLFIKNIGAGRLIGGGIIIFGICVCCLSLAKNVATVLGIRFVVGVGEAVLQSSVIFLSYWYQRDELCTRIAIFYSAATLSGCFSGLIAYGVEVNLDGDYNRHAWQWLFIIEGSLALLVGIVVVMLMPPFPDKMNRHWLFKNEEIDFAIKRLKSYHETYATFQYKQIFACVRDPNVWFISFVNTANATIIASVGAFLPSIIHQFGYTAVRTQLFSIIPYACAFFAVLAVCWLSDKMNKKALFIAGSLGTCVAGLILLMATTSISAKMFAACLVVGGVYPAAVMQIAWVNINVCGHTKRAIAYGISQLLGQGFSMLGAQIYTDPPRYLKGHGALLAFATWGILNTCAAAVWMTHQNRKRESTLEEYRVRGEDHPDLEKSFEEHYDQHILFRYVI